MGKRLNDLYFVYNLFTSSIYETAASSDAINHLGQLERGTDPAISAF